MNKLEERILENPFLPVIILIWIIIIGCLITLPHVIIKENKMKENCRDMGFYKLTYYNNKQVCEDYDGNIHFMKFNCSGYINVKCSAKQISIGGVFEIGKNG